MTDSIQSLLGIGALKTTLFPPNSRYHDVDTLKYTRPDGVAVVYLQRRFIPQRSAFAALVEHTVVDGDRGDLLAARYLGDAELAWRLYDANVVFDPTELTAQAGMRISITLPAGIPAPASE